MENLFYYLASSFTRRTAPTGFKRYLIGRSGCSSLLLNNQPTLHCKLTAEGERVYFYEHNLNGVTYGLITVNVKEGCAPPQAEALLIHYLHQIQKPFGIAHGLRVEIGMTPAGVELTDYWQDEGGRDWKVRGLCNGAVLAVLYVKNIGRCRVSEHETYLDGFRFYS